MKKNKRLDAIYYLILASALLGMQLGFLGANLQYGHSILAFVNFAGAAVLCYPIHLLIKFIMEN